MNIKKMIVNRIFSRGFLIRFKYYGDFHSIRHLSVDCEDEMSYIGNSIVDGAPIFTYDVKDIEKDLLFDFKELSIYLRKLKLKKLKNEEMSKNEISTLSFFNFFMTNDYNSMIKGVVNNEIKYLYVNDDSNYSSTSS